MIRVIVEERNAESGKWSRVLKVDECLGIETRIGTEEGLRIRALAHLGFGLSDADWLIARELADEILNRG